MYMYMYNVHVSCDFGKMAKYIHLYIQMYVHCTCTMYNVRIVGFSTNKRKDRKRVSFNLHLERKSAKTHPFPVFSLFCAETYERDKKRVQGI
jgi:hypothetical protein